MNKASAKRITEILSGYLQAIKVQNTGGVPPSPSINPTLPNTGRTQVQATSATSASQRTEAVPAPHSPGREQSPRRHAQGRAGSVSLYSPLGLLPAGRSAAISSARTPAGRTRPPLPPSPPAPALTPVTSPRHRPRGAVARARRRLLAPARAGASPCSGRGGAEAISMAA